jgi:hypothetical protein
VSYWRLAVILGQDCHFYRHHFYICAAPPLSIASDQRRQGLVRVHSHDIGALPRKGVSAAARGPNPIPGVGREQAQPPQGVVLEPCQIGRRQRNIKNRNIGAAPPLSIAHADLAQRRRQARHERPLLPVLELQRVRLDPAPRAAAAAAAGSPRDVASDRHAANSSNVRRHSSSKDRREYYRIIIQYYEGSKAKRKNILRNSLIYCQKLLRNYLDVTKSDEM